MWSSRHSDWADTFCVNTTAHYFLSVALLPLLAAASQMDLGGGRLGSSEGRGVIIITSSCASMHNATNVDLTSYATSKAGTDHLVKLLAAKFRRFYVRVAGINPGCECFQGMRTDFVSDTTLISVVPSNMNPVGEEGNMFSSLFDKVPAKRPGSEEDIAGAVMYLVSRAGVSPIPFFLPRDVLRYLCRLTLTAFLFVSMEVACLLQTVKNEIVGGNYIRARKDGFSYDAHDHLNSPSA